MKKLFIVLTITLIVSCTQRPGQDQLAPATPPKIESVKVGSPIVDEELIMTNFNSFWTYYIANIKFFEDFVPFDTSGIIIKKADFLKRLITGTYYPLAIYSKDALINYKLVKIPANAPMEIGAYMRQDSRHALEHYEMEGKTIPTFSFTDLNGKHYNSENTKGKIVLFKCWFIKCGACILEMPQLNKMVEKYKERDDIVFISLAIDQKKPLQDFLKTTQFDYVTIPDQGEYMNKQLKVPAYPWHFIINKQGLLIKAVGEATDVEMLLERELKK